MVALKNFIIQDSIRKFTYVEIGATVFVADTISLLYSLQMTTGLGHLWADVFQAAGTTLDWTWAVGEREHYWAFSIRPFQANSDVETLRQFTTTDNNSVSTEHFVVRTSTGNNFRFSAIVVSGA